MESLSARDGTEHGALKRDAASLLGQILLEFGHLEVNLGLCLVWVAGGEQLEIRTKQFESATFNAKLEALESDVQRTSPRGSERRTAYLSWIKRAHELRELRNQLAHGRWGFDETAGHVVNVAGLPTSSVQQESRYKIEDLAAIAQSLRVLTADLGTLRRRWPL